MKNTKNVLFALFAMVSCMSLSAFAEEATEPTVYEFNSINTFITAYNSAQAGDIIRMSADTTVAQLNTTGAVSAGDPIYKQVIIDLNGYTLTTTSGWGGMMLGGYASVINGTVLHKGNTCAIKAYEVDRLEDLTIIIESAKSNTGGVSLRNHASMGYAHINTIKNVKMIGTGNYGIETYGQGDSAYKTRPVIDLIENVEIDSITYGLDLSASVGTIKNSIISGSQSGISIKNSNNFTVTINFEGDNEIMGGNSAVLINYSSTEGTVGITADKYTNFVNTSGGDAFAVNVSTTTAPTYDIVGYTVDGNTFTECEHNVVGGSCTERAVCSLCGKVLDYAHNFVEDVSKREPSNCTVQGKAYFNCECGATKEEFIARDPDAHEWVTTTTEATCTEAGSISYNCKYGSCVGEEYSEEIPATGHNYVETNRVEPSDGVAGYIEYTCQNCSDVITEELASELQPVAASAITIEGDEAKITVGEASSVKVYFCENLGDEWTEVSGEFADGVVTVPATTATGFFKVEAAK